MFGVEEQKQKYLPKLCSGEMISAIAMTEPGAGSDLQGVRTNAVKSGDDYIINGSKTFITNGWLSDLVIVVAKTDPAKGAKGISLFLVETNTPGFKKGKKLNKMGMKVRRRCSVIDVYVDCLNRRKTLRNCSSKICESRSPPCWARKGKASLI